MSGLPWRVRARLWWTTRVDRAAIWLALRGRTGAAWRLWRVTGLIKP